MKFLSLKVALYLYKSTIRPCMGYCCHVWAGAPSYCLELSEKLLKQICRTVGPSSAASLEPLAHCRNVASVSLFYIYRRLSYPNNKIATGFESGLYTGVILIDLQKDFDTVNHDILLKKMEFIGFSEETTKWFKSYLSNRKFKVHIKNNFSEPGNLLCGVPQGSI